MARRRLSTAQRLAAEVLEHRRLLSATSGDAGGAPAGLGVGYFPSDDAYADAVVAAAALQWQGLFGQPAYGFGPEGMPGGVFFFDTMARESAGSGAAVSEVGSSAGPAVSVDASETNTQVVGVDEADLVETDGDRLLTLSGGRLSIVAGLTNTPHLVGQFDLPSAERATGMFLSGTRLTILASAHGADVPAAWAELQSAFWQRFRQSSHTTITVLDVADPTAIAVISRTRLDGELVASRMVDGQLRLVMNHRLAAPEPLVVSIDADPVQPTVSEGDVLASSRHAPSPLKAPPWRWIPEGVYETEAAYVARVRQEVVAAMQPKAYQLDASGVVTVIEDLVAATSIDIPSQARFQQLTTVTAVDVAGGEIPELTSVGLLTVGQTEVYATASSVYVFDGHTGTIMPPGVPVIADWSGIAVWEPPATDVARVDVRAGDGEVTSVGLAALGTFEGTLLNRFAVAEQDGFLHAIVEQRADGHGVVVLETQGESLAVVGSLGGIAADEQLYAARIADNRAYFVTFRFTDPLFVVDLAVPTAPRLLGELHVPGYADHLQPLDDGLLLAIGRDADERTGMFLGLQMSLFDVSAPENPVLLHRYTFAGGRGTSTPITGDRWLRGDGDPLALGFFPEQGVVTIPMTTEGAAWWWSADDVMSIAAGPVSSVADAALWRRPPPPKQTLEVIRFDRGEGITPVGSIDHAASIERAVRVADRLVAVSSSEVSVHSFHDVTVPLESLKLDDQPRVPILQPDHARPTSLAPLLEEGFPLFGSWAVQAIEAVGDEEIAYATHASGAIHRLSRRLGDADWAGFAFERVSNLESTWLSPEARGRAAPLPPANAVAPVVSLVSDAILSKLGLVRDAEGRLVRA
jgi:hypothetical protein